MKRIDYKSVCLTLIILMLGFFWVWRSSGSLNCFYVAIVLAWANNMIFALGKVKERIVFLLFNFTLGFFMLPIPFIRLMEGDPSYLYRFLPANRLFALQSVFLTLVTLWLGAVIFEGIYKLIQHKKKEKKTTEKPAKEIHALLKKCGVENREEWIKYLRLAAELIFYISLVCYLILRMEEYLFVRQGTYLDFYTSFTSKMPYFVYVISSFMKYALVIFLATLPTKRRTFLPLALYFVSAIPSLLVGVRNPIAQNMIFVFLYYVIRDAIGDKEKWIGKIEKLSITIMVPVTVVVFAVYTYTRNHMEVAAKNLVDLVVGFLEGQGITFEVLNIAHGCAPLLPQREFRNYTFGGFIDYFTHGKIAQVFFGAEPLPGGNNLTMALESNSYAHNMSYIAKGSGYLRGQGYGSSYILEVFTDYGYIGLAIFSLVLGAFMIFVMKKMGKGIFSTAFLLMCLTSLFFVPRASATGWLEFILTAQCWVSVAGVLIGAVTLKKLYCFFKKRVLGK